MSDPLHIIGLEIENVKRIRAVEIHPEGDIVVLTGRNAQGKTSVLDAIWLALGGGVGKRGTSTSSPIREGEDTARVAVDFGELLVTRTWRRTETGEVTTSLRVESEGRSFGSPQAVLDALLGSAGFDPLAFTRLDDKGQVAALAAVVDVGFDPEQFDSRTQALFAERTDVNRDVERLAAQVDGMPRYPNAPDEPVSVDEIVGTLRRLRNEQQERALSQNAILDLDSRLQGNRDRIADLEVQIARLRDTVAALVEEREQHVATLEGQPDHTADIADLEDRLATAGETNEKVTANARHREAEKHLAGLRALADGLTAQIEERRQEKRDALAAATFPVDGLGFDDGKVTYQGQPFSQASAAEQVQVSTAIAMAGNPRLRVITIRDASLLDSEHLAIIERMAAEHGYQVWLERIEDDDPRAVVIEDGTVKS